MYRGKEYRERDLQELYEDLAEAARAYPDVKKVFIADGDPLAMETSRWLQILHAVRDHFPQLRRVSTYATANNVLEKSLDELAQLREAGLSLLYIGPESGDAVTLKRIVKGGSFEDHAEAAKKAHAAGMKLSVIMLLGAGGVDRTKEHAHETARLVTEMDPEFLSALTLTIIPGTPISRMMEKGKFELPSIPDLLRELRTIVAESEPTSTIFRTNHASNYLPIEGRLPRDRYNIVHTIDSALKGEIPLRPEYWRAL
jgi:radical SAM superfamily enzyme YgiQ (UPF0313 family)